MLVVSLCMLVTSHRHYTPAPGRSPVVEWYSVAASPPGTSGGRVLLPQKPATAQQSIQSVPSDHLGKIVFNPPDRMTVGKRDLVEAVITTTNLEQVIASLKGKGKPQVEPLLVASRMRVELIGSDFTIVNRGSQEQWVDESEPTPWSWDVTPRKAGEKLVLTLKVTRVMQVTGDGLVRRDLPSLELPIIVTADYWYSTGRWVSDNKSLVVPAVVSLTISLLVPWLGGCLKKRRLRRRKKEALRSRLLK